MSNRYRYVAIGLLSTAMMSLGSAVAWADDESIVLDLVRHGQSVDNAAGIIDTEPPGTELTQEGVAEAQDLASPANPQQLDAPGSYAGIYASDEIRALETAQDWLTAADAPATPVTQLAGLDEIDAGVFNGDPTNSLEGILYFLGPISWVFGDVLVPELGDPSLNGVVFDQDFSGAVQTIYDNTVSGAGSLDDLAFSSEGAIAVWTLMNVNNPDFSALLTTYEDTGQFLPNTGQVVVEGSPGDWTLVSYDGIAVPADPGLPTELFVDFRNLIEAPQFAGYDIYEALLTGNSAIIDSAIQTGLSQVDTALTQFPVEVFDDIVSALGGSV
jgi:Histidine phosphatase superfamily (branch 1)